MTFHEYMCERVAVIVDLAGEQRTVSRYRDVVAWFCYAPIALVVYFITWALRHRRRGRPLEF